MAVKGNRTSAELSTSPYTPAGLVKRQRQQRPDASPSKPLAVHDVALQGSRPEHAQCHRDLPGMVNRVFYDSLKHSFVRIVTPRNLFCQIRDGKIPNLLFEEFATLGPARDEFVPGNRWLGPFLFGLPCRQRISVGSIANSFIPKAQMLKQRRNGMRPWNGWRRPKLRRNLLQQLSERSSVPRTFNRRGAVGIGDSFSLVHV